MRDDLLAKRLFYGGCLGLPWLWVVHVLYWWGKQRRENQENNSETQEHQQGLLQSTETDEDYTDESTQATLSAEQVKLEAKKWVNRSLYGAIIVCSLWLAWIIVFQVFSDKFGPEWFVRSEDEAERTGW